MNREDYDIGYFEWNSKLIIFTVVKPEPNLEDLIDFNEGYQKIVDEFIEGEYISVFDATAAKWLDGKGRIEFGKIAKEQEEKYIGRFLIDIIVIPNPILNMILKGVNLVSKPKIPQKVFKTRDDALEFAEEEVSKL